VGQAPGGEVRPAPLVRGLKNVDSVALAADGRLFATVPGEAKEGGGAVVLLRPGQAATPYVTGLDQPRGLGAFQGSLYILDGRRVRRIDPKGKLQELAVVPDGTATLNDLAVDPENGTAYVSDEHKIYRVNPK